MAFFDATALQGDSEKGATEKHVRRWARPFSVSIHEAIGKTLQVVRNSRSQFPDLSHLIDLPITIHPPDTAGADLGIHISVKKAKNGDPDGSVSFKTDDRTKAIISARINVLTHAIRLEH